MQDPFLGESLAVIHISDLFVPYGFVSNCYELDTLLDAVE